MATKRFYVTIEIEADVNDSVTEQTQREKLCQFIRNGLSQKKCDYNFDINHSHIMSYINEKGKQL